jgi:MurNAc alpha-1-phosphate uridylyltransferase
MFLKNGDSYGVRITYSHEGDEPLGTGGGVQKALTMLGDGPFILLNGDIWTDFDYARLKCETPAPVHLVLVDNPDHNPTGDFALSNGRVQVQGTEQLTYSGIGTYTADFFRHRSAPMFSIVPALKQAMDRNEVSGEYHAGIWFDIGTPERLGKLENWLRESK